MQTAREKNMIYEVRNNTSRLRLHNCPELTTANIVLVVNLYRGYAEVFLVVVVAVDTKLQQKVSLAIDADRNKRTLRDVSYTYPSI